MGQDPASRERAERARERQDQWMTREVERTVREDEAHVSDPEPRPPGVRQPSGSGLRGPEADRPGGAEDPDRSFMPSAGTITALHLPGGPSIRVDSHIYQGYAMPPYYDSLLAKVIAWGETRDESIARMKRALHEFTVEGIATPIPFHQSLLTDPKFVAGEFDIHYVTELFSEAVVV